VTGDGARPGLAGATGQIEASDQAAAQLRVLADRAALSDMISGYFLALDERTFDEAQASAMFTDDVTLSFPPGDHRGLAGLSEFTAGFMAHWALTHHHCSDVAIELGGDRAALRWEVVATHVHHGSPPPPAQGNHFQLGGRFRGAAVRTERGWRITRLALRVLWTAGTGIPSIAATMASSRAGR
jgi:SnoaL-like domain